MAVEQGTATNFVDFYNKLRDFLTTNTTLVGLGQEWVQISGNVGTLTLDDEIVLQGPGLSGDDEVRIRLVPGYSAVDNRYNLALRAVPNWNPLVSPISQFNISGFVIIHLWNSSMPYTFVANGRRFVFVAQVSTVVQAGYGGFILPYALPTEYPYPIAVGGTSSTSSWSYNTADIRHCHFVTPANNSLRLYSPSNTWINFSNFTASGSTYSWSSPGSVVLPVAGDWTTQLARLRECIGGDYPLHPYVMISNTPTVARLGVLDGCYRIPGIGTSHGSLLDIDSPEDHMVVQNVNRTDNLLGFWALRLE
jgi:hypothetical protein